MEIKILMKYTVIDQHIKLLPYIKEDYEGNTVSINGKKPEELFSTIDKFVKAEINRLPATHIKYQSINTGKIKTTKFKMDSDYIYGFHLQGKRVYKGLDVLWTQSDAHKASKYCEDIEELNPSFITVDNPCMYEYTYVNKITTITDFISVAGNRVVEKLAIIAIPENDKEYEQMLIDLRVSKF